jgi:hypothetical protein
MTEMKNRLVLFFAIVGICALAYVFWHVYQRHAAAVEHQQRFTAPEPSGLPNFLNATPGAPPPQP